MKIIKYSIKFLVIALLLSGCSGTKRTKILLPDYEPGCEIIGNRLNTVRNGEGVEVWYFTRYTDPSATGMYKNGKYYRLKRKATWNLNPVQKDYSGNSGEIYNEAWKEINMVKMKKIETMNEENRKLINDINIGIGDVEKKINKANEESKLTLSELKDRLINIRADMGKLQAEHKNLLVNVSRGTDSANNVKNEIDEIKREYRNNKEKFDKIIQEIQEEIKRLNSKGKNRDINQDVFINKDKNKNKIKMKGN